jgi:hypothetical protein
MPAEPCSYDLHSTSAAANYSEIEKIGPRDEFVPRGAPASELQVGRPIAINFLGRFLQ